MIGNWYNLDVHCEGCKFLFCLPFRNNIGFNQKMVHIEFHNCSQGRGYPVFLKSWRDEWYFWKISPRRVDEMGGLVEISIQRRNWIVVCYFHIEESHICPIIRQAANRWAALKFSTQQKKRKSFRDLYIWFGCILYTILLLAIWY